MRIENETLTLDLQYSAPFLREGELNDMAPATMAAAKMLHAKTGPGAEFLGWLDWPRTYDKAEFRLIKQLAKKVTKQSEVCIVIGIGGSYLGAKAAVEFCGNPFHNLLSRKERSAPQMLFAGTNLSGSYLHQMLEYVSGKTFSVIVISKSGTTTEPAIAFRLFKELLVQQYGEIGAKDRIIAITDAKKGALKTLSDQEGYPTLVVPDDIGGRFSVLTAVGLLPIAIAGIDIDAMMKGATAAMADAKNPFENNACYQYAAIRNVLYNKGKAIEMLINYEPQLHYIAEWWKQLFGESEGKDGKGLFTASADFTSDLHSMGQYIQDGRRHLFETLLHVENTALDVTIPSTKDNLDGLNYLHGKTIHYVNSKAVEGTLEAHVDGGVPNVMLRLKDTSPFTLGYLFFFFEKACAVSGYMLGVNPFDQPGVEAYKKNMFRLLGK